MNVNNRIPFENNPSLFRKGTRNDIIKKIRSNELKLDIVFFGEITINGFTYYKYACYVMNGKTYYLTLQERLVPKITFKRSNPKLLTFSSSSRTLTQIPSINLKTPQDFKTELVVVKIPKKHVEYNLNTLLEHLKSQNSIKENKTVQLLNRNIRPINTREEYTDTTYRIDPDGIILSDLQYNDTPPFKIIRKSLTNLSRINHPFIFFGEIVIDGIKYYRYVCYNSKGVGSFNGGVAFRELVHGRNKRISRIRTNIDAQNLDVLNFFDSSNASSRPRHRPPHSSIEMQNVSKKYLYYIPIEEINSAELRKLIKNIDEYRRLENRSFSRTIYDYVKGVLLARGEEKENSPFALKNNEITNKNL